MYKMFERYLRDEDRIPREPDVIGKSCYILEMFEAKEKNRGGRTSLWMSVDELVITEASLALTGDWDDSAFSMQSDRM